MTIRPPRLFTVISLGFLILPLANYAVLAWVHDLSAADPAGILQTPDLLGLIVLLAPFAVGAGLLLRRAWGWWLFVLYAPLLIVFNLRSLLRAPSLFDVVALAQTVAAVAVVAYLGRRDIYAPLLSGSLRGWRSAPRYAMRSPIWVDGELRHTLDVSASGCLIEWPTCPLQPGHTLALRVAAEPEPLSFEGRIARIEAEVVGVEFLGLDRARRRTVARALRAGQVRGA